MKIKSTVWQVLAAGSFGAGLLYALGIEGTAQVGGTISDSQFITAMALILAQARPDLAAEAILRGSRPLTLRCSGQWTGASFEGKGEVNPRGDVGVRLAGTFRKLELPRLGERFPDLKGLAPQGTAQGTLLVEGPAKALRFTVFTARW